MVVKWREKRKTTEVMATFKCSCHLHATKEHRQTMCGSDVERKRKTTRVNGNVTYNMINVLLSLTNYNGAEIDDVW